MYYANVDSDVRERIVKSLVSFVELVVEKEKKGVATPDELEAMTEVAKTLMSC